MSKSILIIDTPECCDMCKMGFHNEYSDGFECFWESTKHLVNPKGKRPDWCPLKEMPLKKLWNKYHNDYEKGSTDGFNDCIDEILKECDENEAN